MSAQYAKAITAAIGAGITAAISYYPHASWIPIASAICTLLATYAIPNVAKTPVSPAQLSVPDENNVPAPVAKATAPDTGNSGPEVVPLEDLLTFSERTGS